MGRTVAMLLAASLATTPLPARAADRLVLEDFMLVDGTGAPARQVGRMLVVDGRIAAIDALGEAPERTTLETETRIDLGGAWVMPGLVDTHVHVARFPDTRVQAQRILEQAVRGGVTSVRDLGGDTRALAEIDRATRQDELMLPTVVFAGMYGGPEIFERPPISQFGSDRKAGTTPWTRALTPGLDLPLAVAQTKGAGATGIKVYGNLDTTAATRVIAEAHRQGLMAWAHATVFPAGPRELVEAGVDSLSHAPYLVWAAVDDIPADYGARIAGPWEAVAPDHPALLSLFRAMAGQGVSLDATLYVFDRMQSFSPEVQADWAPMAFAWAARATAQAHRLGVPITAGTDWFEPREGELPHTHDELELLVRHAGLTTMEAIVAGTRNGAAAAGLLEERGTLEIGKAADLLVLEASPLEDIRNTRKILRVVKDGVLVRPGHR